MTIMEPFLYYLLRASVLVGLFWGFYKLFFARTTFHSINRVLLQFIVSITILLPLFRFNLLPVKEVDPILLHSLSIDFTMLSMAEEAGITPSLSIPWIPLLMTVFVAGLLLTVTRYLIGLRQIAVLVRKSEKHLLDDGTVLCVSNKNISPFSWMKYAVLSHEDFLADHYAILRHEKAHIRLKHARDLILFDLFTCLLWFNPFSWLLRREIQSVHEYQADAHVLAVDIDPKQYQLLLIRKSVGEQKFALANNFRQRDLHQRIIMMMKSRTNQRKKWNYALTLPALFLAMIALSVPKMNARIVGRERDKAADKETVVFNQVNDTINIELRDPVDDTIEIDSKEHGEFQTGDGNYYIIRGVDAIKNKPLIFIDNKKVTSEEFNELIPDDIASISILKDKSAIDLYGKEGENGVILIETKAKVKNKEMGSINLEVATPERTNREDTLSGKTDNTYDKVATIGNEVMDSLRGNGNKVVVRSKNEVLIESALYIVDNEKMDSEFDVSSIDPKDIESISVLKGKSALDLYGEEGKNGVVIINLKKAENKPVE